MVVSNESYVVVENYELGMIVRQWMFDFDLVLLLLLLLRSVSKKKMDLNNDEMCHDKEHYWSY